MPLTKVLTKNFNSRATARICNCWLGFGYLSWWQSVVSRWDNGSTWKQFTNQSHGKSWRKFQIAANERLCTTLENVKPLMTLTTTPSSPPIVVGNRGQLKFIVWIAFWVNLKQIYFVWSELLFLVCSFAVFLYLFWMWMSHMS